MGETTDLQQLPLLSIYRCYHGKVNRNVQ